VRGVQGGLPARARDGLMGPWPGSLRWMRGSVAKLYTDFGPAPQPTALLCALFAIAVLGSLGAADAAVSKTLTLLPPLSANATTRDVFLNSTSKIQLCVHMSRTRRPGPPALAPIRPAPAHPSPFRLVVGSACGCIPA